MMGWGESHNAGTGTSAEIEAAHDLMDTLNVPTGNLAYRARILATLGHVLLHRITAVVEAIEACYPEPNAIDRAESHRYEAR